jgi:hypothetical protein
VLSDGRVYAWGDNSSGQLGTGATTQQNTAVQVTFPAGLGGQIVEISAGATHSLARDNLAQVWSWGSNTSGELGDGTNTAHWGPLPISSIVNANQIAAGGPDPSGGVGGHSLASGCGGAERDARVLVNLTADKDLLLHLTNGPSASCPTLPTPKMPGTSNPGTNTTYMCGLKSGSGVVTGTNVRNAFDIALNKSINPIWNLYETSRGGRAESKKFLVIMTDGLNQALPIDDNTANTLTTIAANAMKSGPNNTVDTPCFQTTTPPCDDVEIYTVGFFDGNQSNFDGPPALCGIGNTAIPANPSTFDSILIAASTSTPGTCDHYFPLKKGQDLPQVFTAIATDILRGQLTN